MAAVLRTVAAAVGRNSTRIAWLAAAAGSCVALVKYARLKWDEAQAKHEAEQAARANIKYRFEQNIQDCSFVAASLLPTLSDQLFEHLNVEVLTAKLQQSRQQSRGNHQAQTHSPASPIPPEQSDTASSKQPSKLQLWEELKISSFTRTIAAVYLVNMLTVFTSLQLSILGRFFYLDSVAAIMHQESNDTVIQNNDHVDSLHNGVAMDTMDEMDDPRWPGRTRRTSRLVSQETERQYLTFSWYLLNIGWRKCVDRVQRSVENVLGSTSLKQDTRFADLVAIVDSVRQSFELDDIQLGLFHRMDEYLLPGEGNEISMLREGGITIEDGGNRASYVLDLGLKRLLDETRDFLESPDFEIVMRSCLDESFRLLMDQFRPSFFTMPTASMVLHSSKQTADVAEASGGMVGMSQQNVDGEMNKQADQNGQDHVRAQPSYPSVSVDGDGNALLFAKVVPIVSRSVHQIMNGVPNLFLDVVASNPKLRALAVVAYTGWE